MPPEPSSAPQPPSQNVWTHIGNFLRQYPSAGVVLLIIPLVPVLSRVLDDDDPIGPILWALIIIVALPGLFNVVRAIFDSFLENTIVRNMLVMCFGFCCGVLMLAGTGFLVFALYQNMMSGAAIAGTQAPITEEEVRQAQRADNQPQSGPQILDRLLGETVEVQELPAQGTAPQIAAPQPDPEPPAPGRGPASLPGAPLADLPDAPIEEMAVVENNPDPFEACVNAAFDAGDAEGILDCLNTDSSGETR